MFNTIEQTNIWLLELIRPVLDLGEIAYVSETYDEEYAIKCDIFPVLIDIIDRRAKRIGDCYKYPDLQGLAEKEGCDYTPIIPSVNTWAFAIGSKANNTCGCINPQDTIG